MAITTAKGTVLQMLNTWASGGTYSAAISQVRSITGPTVKPKLVDITTHDTPGFWSRKATVLIEAGDISFEVNFDHMDASHAFTTGMWNQMVGLIKTGLRMIFPNSAGTLTFPGYVAGHEFNAPVDNILSAKISMAITDNIVAS